MKYLLVLLVGISLPIISRHVYNIEWNRQYENSFKVLKSESLANVTQKERLAYVYKNHNFMFLRAFLPEADWGAFGTCSSGNNDRNYLEDFICKSVVGYPR
jgi:hypothetical protein